MGWRVAIMLGLPWPAATDALNLLFVLIPIINVGLPFVAKSFPVIFTTDCAVMVAVYAWKVGLPGLPKTS